MLFRLQHLGRRRRVDLYGPRPNAPVRSRAHPRLAHPPAPHEPRDAAAPAPLTVTLLGPPGAGKGTQAARLCDELELAYVATGDMLRGHRSRGTELGLAASEHMSAGRLVPDELVIAMITEALPDDPDAGLVIDGFPRTVAQARSARRVAARSVGADSPPRSSWTWRTTWSSSASRAAGCVRNGHVFHVLHNAPEREGICDEDGEPLVRRDDDEPADRPPAAHGLPRRDRAGHRPLCAPRAAAARRWSLVDRRDPHRDLSGAAGSRRRKTHATSSHR